MVQLLHRSRCRRISTASAVLTAMPPTAGTLPASGIATGTVATAAVASPHPQRACRTTMAQATTAPALTARGLPMARLE